MEVVMVNILVCDDDKEIAGALEIYLRNEATMYLRHTMEWKH